VVQKAADSAKMMSLEQSGIYYVGVFLLKRISSIYTVGRRSKRSHCSSLLAVIVFSSSFRPAWAHLGRPRQENACSWAGK